MNSLGREIPKGEMVVVIVVNKLDALDDIIRELVNSTVDYELECIVDIDYIPNFYMIFTEEDYNQAQSVLCKYEHTHYLQEVV